MSSDELDSFLPGAHVAAKFKGAFCEATVTSVDKNVKIKMTDINGDAHVIDATCIQSGDVKVGGEVIALLPSGETCTGTIGSLKDNSIYHVLFNDGDTSALKRNQISPGPVNGGGSGHASASDEEEQLRPTSPTQLTGNASASPTVAPDRSPRPGSGASSDKSVELETPVIAPATESPLAAPVLPVPSKAEEQKCRVQSGSSVSSPDRKQLRVGDVVMMYDDRKRWFPALVVSSQSCKSLEINPRREIAVRSFKDGKTMVTARKDLQEFDFDKAKGPDVTGTLKIAVEKCLKYIEQDELPPLWDKIALLTESSETAHVDDDDGATSEERDRFVAYLYKFMDERGTPINKQPAISGVDLDLYRLHRLVQSLGGCNRITKNNAWSDVLDKLNLGETGATAPLVKSAYSRYLASFDAFYRKLGVSAEEISRVYQVKSGQRTSARSGSAGEPELTDPTAHAIAPRQAGQSERRLLPISVRRGMGLQNKAKQNNASRKLAASWLTKARRVLGGSRPGQLTPPSRPFPPTSPNSGSSTPSSEKRSEARKEYDSQWTSIEKSDGLTAGRMVKIKYGAGTQKRNYQAKIIKIESHKSQPTLKRFFVHYFGWNSRYDEFVDRSRIILTKKDEDRFATTAAAERKFLASKPPAVPAASAPGRRRQESGKGKEAPILSRKRQPSNVPSEKEAERKKSRIATTPKASTSSGFSPEYEAVEPAHDDSDFSSAETDSLRSWGKASSAPSRPSPRFTPSYEMPAALEDYAAQEASRWVPPRSGSAAQPRSRPRRRPSRFHSGLDQPDAEPSFSASSERYTEAWDEPDDASVGNRTPMRAPSDEAWPSEATSGRKKVVTRRRKKRITHMPGTGHRKVGKPLKTESGGASPSKALGSSSPQYGPTTAALRQQVISEMNSDPNWQSKYKFDVFDPNVKGEEKINLCLERMQAIRSIYQGLKLELADLDKKRKRAADKKKRLARKKHDEGRARTVGSE